MVLGGRVALVSLLTEQNKMNKEKKKKFCKQCVFVIWRLQKLRNKNEKKVMFIGRSSVIRIRRNEPDPDPVHETIC